MRIKLEQKYPQVFFAKPERLPDGRWKVICRSQYPIAYPQLPAHPKPTVYDKRWHSFIHPDLETAYEKVAEKALNDPLQVVFS